jgi:hypothetical protein
MFSKLVVVTQKFKEKNGFYILETFLNAMIRNIKLIHNIIDIIEISKSMEPNNLIFLMMKMFI